MQRLYDVQVLVIDIQSEVEARMIAQSLPAEVESVMVSVMTWEQFRQALREHVAPIVHIVGRILGAEAVELEDKDGMVRGAGRDTLARCRNALAPLDVVVLDGCYDTPQARSWLGHVNAVIGIPEAVPMAASAQFSCDLYRALERKRTLVDAFDACLRDQRIELLTREDVADVGSLRELLVELRKGYTLLKPILVEVEPGSRIVPESSFVGTVTPFVRPPLDWAEQYAREYAGHTFLVLGENSLVASLETPVIIGRSRRCDVRVDNDSMSKVHASIVFDSASAEYYIVDENSRNGTCINGEALTPGVPAAVWSGAYLSFGDALFVFIDPPTLRKLAKRAG